MKNEIQKGFNDEALFCLYDEYNEIPHYFRKEKDAIENKKRHKIRGFIFQEGKN